MSSTTIVTLTPNPSNDRTVTLAGPLERGAVQRLLSVTMQAGGKGVNISRAAMSAGLDTEAVFPARPDDPFVRRADLAQASPAARRRPPATYGSTSRSPSPTAPRPSSTAPARRCPRPPRRPRGDAARAGRRRRRGSCSPGRCRRARPTAGTPSWCAALHGTPARVAVDTSEGPLAALVAALPDAAPDLMKPNGSELASFVGGDEDVLRGRPGDGRRGGAPARRQGRGRGPGDPGRRRGLPGHRGGRLARHAAADQGGQHGGRGRLQPVRLPARRRTRRFAAPSGSRSPSPTAAPPRPCPALPSPSPDRRPPDRY